MFVEIGLFEDGAHHLFLTEVHRNDRQRIEGCLGGLAPKNVCMFKTPVTERNKDAVELQAFTLVDGENADAVSLAALDGLAADGFFPFVDESVNIRGIVLRKLVQLVVESADVGSLLVKPLQLENVMQSFRQLVDGQL